MSVVRGVGGVCDKCICLGSGGGVRTEWLRGLGLGFTNPEGTGESGIYVCVLVAVVWVVLGECVGGLGQGMGGWGFVKSVFVVIHDYLCSWQVFVYCARRIAAQFRCTQCSILLRLIGICFQT